MVRRYSKYKSKIFISKWIGLKRGKEAVNLINGCINSKTNFNFESTLSGRGIFNKIKYAKSNGFEVDIIYIAIDKKTSKLRINSRVLKGGHNISNEDVERRYDKSISNFINNINIFDNVYFYENEESKHNLIFFIESGRLKYLKNSIPEWIEIKLDLKNMLDKFKNE